MFTFYVFSYFHFKMKAIIHCFWLLCLLLTMDKEFSVDCRPAVVFSIQELLQMAEILESESRFLANENSDEQVVNNRRTEFPIISEEIVNGKIS